MRWAALNMGKPVVGEKIPGSDELATEDTEFEGYQGQKLKALQPPTELHRRWWRVANGQHGVKFLERFAKAEEEMRSKSDRVQHDPDQDKTQTVAKLLDKILADWDQGKRG